MAEKPAKIPEALRPGDEVAFTEQQSGVFRSAGFWMSLVGWMEVVVGSLTVLACLLGMLEAAPQIASLVVGPLPWDKATAGVRGAGLFGIGILTLIAATSFRRAGEGAEAVTKAVSNLQELYERQVWLFALIVAVVVGAAIFGR